MFYVHRIGETSTVIIRSMMYVYSNSSQNFTPDTPHIPIRSYMYPPVFFFSFLTNK